MIGTGSRRAPVVASHCILATAVGLPAANRLYQMNTPATHGFHIRPAYALPDDSLDPGLASRVWG